MASNCSSANLSFYSRFNFSWENLLIYLENVRSFFCSWSFISSIMFSWLFLITWMAEFSLLSSPSRLVLFLSSFPFYFYKDLTFSNSYSSLAFDFYWPLTSSLAKFYEPIFSMIDTLSSNSEFLLDSSKTFFSASALSFLALRSSVSKFLFSILKS